MCKRLWCVYVLSKKQDVNLFVVDGRRHGPLLSKAKGDPASLLVQHIHQCAKMLARGHAGTFILKNTTLYSVPLSFIKLVHPFSSCSSSLCFIYLGHGEGWESYARR